MRNRPIRPLCGVEAASGNICTRTARDSLGCYLHSPNFAEERRRHSSVGGHKGGVSRSSTRVKELRAVRYVIRHIVGRMSCDLLSPRVEGNLNRIVELLRIYTQLTTLEVREGPEERPRGAFRREPALDTQALEEQLHALIEEDTHENQLVRVHGGEHPDDAA